MALPVRTSERAEPVSGKSVTSSQKEVVPAVEMTWNRDRPLNGSLILVFWLFNSQDEPFSSQRPVADVSTSMIVFLPWEHATQMKLSKVPGRYSSGHMTLLRHCWHSTNGAWEWLRLDSGMGDCSRQ